MSTASNQPYGKLKRWQLVLKTAQELSLETFTGADIVKKINLTQPEVPAKSIRTYVIAMAPKHPSYDQYSTHHPCFEFLGNGKYKLMDQHRLSCSPNLAAPKQPIAISSDDRKQVFAQQYGDLIIEWAKQNQTALLTGWRNYRWGRDNSLVSSLERRNAVSRKIALSRIKNNGGLDLEALDSIMEWGFPKNHQFKPRDPNRCIEVTREAFALLDAGKHAEAICKLMGFPLIISRASKIVGLSDPNYFAIYDSRVGLALATLKAGNERLIKIPGRAPIPGKVFPSDRCSNYEWGENYQRLLWILEIIRNMLNEAGYPFSIADVEMALFMMGK
jgi:chorismate mutase